MYELSDDIEIDRKKKHNLELIVDRLVIKPEIRNRLAESIEISLKKANSLVLIEVSEKEKEFLQYARSHKLNYDDLMQA